MTIMLVPPTNYARRADVTASIGKHLREEAAGYRHGSKGEGELVRVHAPSSS